MTRQEHLLICLAEECSEVIKEITKGLRFGLDDINPKKNIDNLECLQTEITDLKALIEMVEHYLPINNKYTTEAKKIKVELWLDYSKKRGLLKE